MNVLIILSGGVGTRVGSLIPKQYIFVKGHPIISYSYQTFLNHEKIDGIIIVAAEMWHSFLKDNVDLNNDKFLGFAPPGNTRQESILNGLVKAREYSNDSCELVLIHDAARPNVSFSLIDNLFNSLEEFDGVMPAIPCTDTLYYSSDKKKITGLIDRDKAFSGQSPELFVFQKYYHANLNCEKDYLKSIRGSSQIAFLNNMKIRVISGEEENYKITTQFDLEKFKNERGDLE